MATVVCNRLLLDFITPELQPAEESHLEIDASNIRQLISQLDQRFPGIAQKLQQGIAVAINGEIFNDPLLESVDEECEVYFLPAIEGG